MRLRRRLIGLVVDLDGDRRLATLPGRSIPEFCSEGSCLSQRNPALHPVRLKAETVIADPDGFPRMQGSFSAAHAWAENGYRSPAPSSCSGIASSARLALPDNARMDPRRGLPEQFTPLRGGDRDLPWLVGFEDRAHRLVWIDVTPPR